MMISQIHSKASNDGLILTLWPSLASPCADWPPQFKQLSRKPEKLPDLQSLHPVSVHRSMCPIRQSDSPKRCENHWTIEDVYKILQKYVPCGFKPWPFDLLHLQLTSSSPSLQVVRSANSVSVRPMDSTFWSTWVNNPECYGHRFWSNSTIPEFDHG